MTDQPEQPEQIVGSPGESFRSNLEICYEILLYLASRMARLQPGEVFEFITGDPEAGDKVPAWCDLRGFTLLESGPVSAGQMRFLIQK